MQNSAIAMTHLPESELANMTNKEATPPRKRLQGRCLLTTKTGYAQVPFATDRSL